MSYLKYKLLTLTLIFCLSFTATATAMEKQNNKKEKNLTNCTNIFENKEKNLNFEIYKTNNMCGFFKYMEQIIKNTNISGKTNNK